MSLKDCIEQKATEVAKKVDAKYEALNATLRKLDPTPPGKVEGVVAQFANPAVLLHAAETVRDAGYENWDCHTPFPVHGLDDAMGLPKSKLGWISAAGGLTGGTIAFALQSWVHSAAYPIVYSGKPFWAYPAYVPVTFELTILFTAFATLGGMLFLNFLPRYNHPVFNSDRMRRATGDGFFVSILADDPKFDAKKTVAWLQSIGGTHVELLIADE
jgi:hypothetical protein